MSDTSTTDTSQPDSGGEAPAETNGSKATDESKSARPLPPLESILDALRHSALTQRELAQRIDATQPQISDWINGKKTPSKKTRRRLVDQLDIKAKSEVYYAKPGREDESQTDPDAFPDKGPNAVSIPYNGESSGGHGRTPDAQNTGEVILDRAEAQRLSNIDASNLRSTTLVGDSMLPEIQPNSIVFYYPTDIVAGDGLYVYDVDEARLIKRIQRQGGGALLMIPENDAYPHERFTPLPDADTPNTYRSNRSELTSVIQIVGKVVFYFKPA
jgi:phage repressor protein C with HTH and peptisase S24 domain